MEDHLKKPDINWVKAILLNLFDFSGNHFSAYFSNEKLKIFQGAASWILDIDNINIPLLQIRKAFKKGSFLKIYDLSDVIAHELVHFARVSFDEPIYEEFFAYLTSTNIIRKIFGPLFSSYKIFYFFLFFLSCSLFFQSLLPLLSALSLLTSFTIITIAILNLFIKKSIFNRCYKKINSILKNKKNSLAVMFRLKDQEIKDFSKMSKKEILNYAKKEKEITLRWKVIYLAYFNNVTY